MSINQVSYIKIYPGIGTARVGNSPEYFIGPESPGEVPNLDKNYKDANGLLKPQAARFRVYGYDANDNIVMEINNDSANGVSVEWDVHARNLKAANYAFQGKFGFDPNDLRNPGVTPNTPGTDPNDRTSLIIDPGMKTISGNNLNQAAGTAVALDGGKIFDGVGSAEIPSSLLNPGQDGTTAITYNSKEVSLGRLETDPSGRLIFVGGTGKAECLTEPPIILQKGVGEINGATNEDPTSNGNSYFNNPGWYDDTCGGSINATVKINGVAAHTTNNEPEKRGWIAVSPPKYVPSMNNVVSLLDLQLDMFPEEDPVSGSLEFAILDSNGIPNISTGNATSFAPLSGVNQSGAKTPSLASFNGSDYYAYIDSNGSLYLAVSTNNGTTWSESQIGTDTSDFAPSICVFNGQLVYVYAGANGYLSMGVSSDGSTFTFESVAPGGGVQATPSVTAPSTTAYNGSLYISFVSSYGALTVAQLTTTSPKNLFTFSALEVSNNSHTIAPSMCHFFGQLYLTYIGTDKKCYIGSYNNYAPAPTPPEIKFTFSHIGGAQTTNLAPAISASHNKLYYALTGTDNSLYVASGKPGFTDLTFTKQGTVITSNAPAVANFNSLTFYRDIYPILRTVTDYAWVNEPAFQGHAPGSMGDFLRPGSLLGYSNPNETNNVYRTFVFNAIRPAEQLTPTVPPPPAALPLMIPSGGTQTGRLMPHLFGEGGSNLENTFNGTNFPNQWLSLTPHQLWKIQEWVNGNFTAGEMATPKSIDSLPLTEQPAALDFSALEPTVGGGFHPGIELTYNMKEPGYFAAPFRFSDNITDATGNTVGTITPGSVAGYMSIPWQGDFWSCNISWWAAMRPDIVVNTEAQNPEKLTYKPWFRGEAVGIPPNADGIDDYEGGYEHMARYWSKFGFVVPTEKRVFDPKKLDNPYPYTEVPEKDLGMFVMGETERAACLDDTSAPCASVNPIDPVHLGYAQANSPSTGPFPDTFYTNTIRIVLPVTGTITLSSTEDGTGDIVVDDQCVIKVNGTQVYSHDYSNGNSGVITPTAPVDITSNLQAYLGKIVTITIEYIDLHPNAKRGSDYWITYSN